MGAICLPSSSDSRSGKATRSSYDVVIVGAGHNGLTAAAFLARAGKSVLVLEAYEDVGGMCATAETLPGAPGFRINAGSVEFVMTQMRPTVADDLELHKHGLRWVDANCLTTYLSPDGGSIAWWRDPRRTADEIAHFSRRDAQQYLRLVESLTAFLRVGTPYLAGHPFRVRPSALWQMAVAAARGRGKVGDGARMLIRSLDSVLDELFEREELKAPLATYALGTWGGPWETASAFALFFQIGFHEWGLRRPVGGSGAYTQALAACVEAHGGEIRTSARVDRIEVDGARARGVRLDDGTFVSAGQVLATVDPHTLVTKLLDEDAFPAKVRDQARSIGSARANIYVSKVDAALSELPGFPKHPRSEPEALQCVTVCPSSDVLRSSTLKAMGGEYTDIPIVALLPSMLDPSLVPAGSDGHVMYLYVMSAPVELSGGRDWEAHRADYTDRIFSTLDAYSPGIRDLVIDEATMIPPDFEPRFNIHKGLYSHIDPTLENLGPLRPIPAMAAHRTPVKGLWHSGASAFPLPFMNGWPGRTASRSMLRSMRTGSVVRGLRR
jgi:beta-carotene ketolase (CrtO type)